MSPASATVSIPQLAFLLRDHVQTHPRFAKHEVLLAQRRLGGVCVRDRETNAEAHIVRCMPESESARRWPFLTETRPAVLAREAGIAATWGLHDTRVALADLAGDGELGQIVVELLCAATAQQRGADVRVNIVEFAQLLRDHVQPDARFAGHDVLLAPKRLGGVCLRDKKTAAEEHVVRCTAESASARQWPFLSETRPAVLTQDRHTAASWGLDGAEVNLGDLVGDGGAGSAIVGLVCAAAVHERCAGVV